MSDLTPEQRNLVNAVKEAGVTGGMTPGEAALLLGAAFKVRNQYAERIEKAPRVRACSTHRATASDLSVHWCDVSDPVSETLCACVLGEYLLVRLEDER